MPNSLPDEDLVSLVEFFEILIEVNKCTKKKIIASTPEEA